MFGITLPIIPLWLPVTEWCAANDAWHKAVAAYHADKTEENGDACNAAYARREAADSADWKITHGPASPFAPFA